MAAPGEMDLQTMLASLDVERRPGVFTFVAVEAPSAALLAAAEGMVREAMAFNLGMAWLFAGTIVGAFGVIYDLIVLSRRSNQPITENSERQKIGLPVTIALVGALAIGLAGNLEIIFEVAHANGIGSDTFWEQLDIRDINTPAVVAETPRYETTGWCSYIEGGKAATRNP